MPRLRQQRPIELFYWPTPNGWKILIMLEECRLPYVVRPVNIAAGEQFKPEFLAISPNNRMPAIIDPQGPGGRPISVFESGAILLYLGRKTGKFYPANERGQVEVEQCLMWQMGGLGPMAGQAHHFRNYAPEQIPYAVERYTNECRVCDSELHIALAPLSSPHRTRAAQALCGMLDQTATIFPGSRLRIRFAVRPPPRIGLAFPGSPVERSTATVVALVP